MDTKQKGGTPKMRVQAVLFDLFETLITEFQHGRRKVDRAKRDYEPLIGIPNDVFGHAWSARRDRRMTGAFRHFKEVVEDILAEHQLESGGRATSIEALYQDRVREKRVPFESIDPSILHMLERLQGAGAKLALISNCTEEEVQGWHDSPLASYFDEAVFSYQVGVAKPDPRIYELTLSRLGVSAGQAAFVGDGGFQELEGAAASGIRNVYQCGWFVPELYRKSPGKATVVESTGQLLEHLGIGSRMEE